MKRLMFAVWILAVGMTARADDAAKAVVAKGITALGGETKLSQAKAFQWKAATKLTLEGDDHDLTIDHASQGLDKYRNHVQGEINGNDFDVTTVIDGKKGRRNFPELNDLDTDQVTNEKRNLYLQIIPITLVPLLGEDFQIDSVGEEKVNGKPASVVKVTGPDKKTFRLLFDQGSGLPVKMVATVVGFGGDDYDQVSFFKDYKEMSGIQKASKIEVTRNGDPFLSATIKEFEIVDSLPAKTFDEPK